MTGKMGGDKNMKDRNNKVVYRKEFFDRDYTMREAYARVWKYARKYKLRLAIGVVCGMATAGTLVPFFQIVQPALQHVESHDAEIERDVNSGKSDSQECQTPDVEIAGSHVGEVRKPRNEFEKQIARNSKLPGWYPKVERLARRCGITLQDESGAMGGALLLIAVVVIPLLAGARLLLRALVRGGFLRSRLSGRGLLLRRGFGRGGLYHF